MFYKYFKIFIVFLNLYAAFIIADIDQGTYFQSSLEAVLQKYSKEEHQNVFSKPKFMGELRNVLMDYLNTADEETFYQQLKLAEPYLKKLTQASEDVFKHITKLRWIDVKTIEINGEFKKVYYNTYSKKEPINQEERDQNYQDELARYNENRMSSALLIEKETLQNLVSGQSYNFVITPEGVGRMGFEQRHHIRDIQSNKRIFITPNHTILAENGPVITAGELILFQHGNKRLYFIASTSGHFKAQMDSLVHMKNYLVALGVPEETIIELAISYRNMEKAIPQDVNMP